MFLSLHGNICKSFILFLFNRKSIYLFYFESFQIQKSKELELLGEALSFENVEMFGVFS